MIILIIGGLGTGKTMLMSYFLYLDYLFEKRKIYANYFLNFAYENIYKMGELSDLPEGLKSLGIDEPYTSGLDSRNSMSKINRIMSGYILQCRKDDMNVYVTSQFLGAIELRTRGLADVVLYPEIVSYDQNDRPLMMEVNVYKMANYSNTFKRPYNTFNIPLQNMGFFAGDVYNTKKKVEGIESTEISEFEDKVKYYSKKTGDMNKTQLTAYIYGHERREHGNPMSKAQCRNIAEFCILIEEGFA